MVKCFSKKIRSFIKSIANFAVEYLLYERREYSFRIELSAIDFSFLYSNLMTGELLHL